MLNVQKKIIRLITFKSYLEHTEPLFHKLKILNIFKINDYLSLDFIYNTRNANKFHVNYRRTNYAKHTVINKGIEIWNSLDEKISNIRSYFTFKIKSKIFFLEYI